MPNFRGIPTDGPDRQDLRSYFDPLFQILSVIFGVALMITVYRIWVQGFHLHTTVQLPVILIGIATLQARQFLSPLLVTWITQSVTFFVCLAGVIQLGLAANALMAFFIIPLLLVVMVSYRAAIMSMVAIAGILLLVGYLHAFQVIETHPDVAKMNSQMSSWIIATVVFSITTFLAIFITNRLSQYWSDASAKHKQQTQEITALIEFAPEAIMVYDLDKGSFVHANPRAAALFDVGSDALTSDKTIDTLFAEPSSVTSITGARQKGPSFAAALQQALDGEYPMFTTNLLPPNGPAIPCEITLSRLPLFDRNLIRFTTTDIRHRQERDLERQALELQLAQSQRLEAVGKLSGGVAHDFNNLLAVILGNAEMLRDKATDPDQLAMLESITSSVKRGSDLTQNMLSFARKARLSPQIVDLNDTVRDMKNWAGRTIPANVDVEVSLLAGLWPIEADPGALQNAILNLLINARDAMEGGGKLTIETSNLRIDGDYIQARNEEVPPGRYVMLAISDTGSGIAPETLQRIFEPFFSTKPAGKGSGLGLSMVLGFMRQSGGTVRVYSEPGEGTTIKLYFKTAKSAVIPDKAPQNRHGSTTARGQSVLVVEDEPELLRLLVSSLTGAGYQVVAATSGDEAFDIFQRNPCFDLLLTDIVMPGSLQGTSLSRALRDLNPDLPAIFMSGYASEATVHGNGLRPEDIRLMKPVSRKALLAAIAKALAPSSTDVE